MPTCFVIQPFDSGKFDKRFEQIYRPAIIGADLDPYRVDKDAHVEIPIESIEAGIRTAAVCLADITTDNPNVWYELGFAFAAGTPVVMICSGERKSYPFDIQHRAVISYTTDAPDDFDNLQEKITARIKALLEKGAGLRRLAEADQLTPVAGLSQQELTLLAVVAGAVDAPNGNVSTYSARHDAERAGITNIAINLALRRLSKKRFVLPVDGEDGNGNLFDALMVTDDGWNWIEKNESSFILRHPVKGEKNSLAVITDEDIPF